MQPLKHSGMKLSATSQSKLVMKSLTVWQYGTSTSVLLLTTLPALLLTLNQESVVVLASAILLRICLVPLTSFQQAASANAFTTLPQLSLKTVLLTTSSSLLQNAETLISVLTSMMTLSGWFLVLVTTSAKQATLTSLRLMFLLIIQKQTKQQCSSTFAVHTTTSLTTWDHTDFL